jgi:hypothetical protein
MNTKKIGLSALFLQRQIGTTRTSIRSLNQLRTPSGPQSCESVLEAELVQQLNFSPHVRDIVTQPIITYEKGGRRKRYTPDVLVELYPCRPERPAYYLLEAKMADALERSAVDLEEKFLVGRKWCEQNFAEFRILTEVEIRTPYRANTQLLGRLFDHIPEPEFLTPIEEFLAKGNAPVADVIEYLVASGIAEFEALAAVEEAVASRMVYCDLSQPFDNKSIISSVDPARAVDAYSDPILRIINSAKSSRTFEEHMVKKP